MNIIIILRMQILHRLYTRYNAAITLKYTIYRVLSYLYIVFINHKSA